MPTPTARIVILFDGTDNTPKDRTNVWRTHELLAETDASGVAQIKHYIQGVGTDFGELARGSIFGIGMARKICEGYEWLVANHQDGAEVYVFGFSRGAFAARSLVQMVATCGLTRPDVLGEWNIDRTFDRYESITQQATEVVRPIWRLRHWQDQPADRPAGWQPTPDDARLLDAAKVRVIKIRMAGLWDTVGAIGTDALENKDARVQKSGAHNVRPTKTQEYGYHALAVDEHRPMFEDTVWRTFVEQGQETATLARYAQYYEQRWFAGAHSDVGGGYGDDSLPDLSLRWMLDKTRALGLAFTHTIEPKVDAWHAPVHDSFKAFAGSVLTIWDELIAGDQRHYREVGRERRSVTTSSGSEGSLWSINETIDDSVLRRWTEDPRYRPPGLVSYFARNRDGLPVGTTLAQQTDRIYANRYWNETGVYLKPNARYRLRVVPNVGEPLSDASFVARSIAGEDWQSVAHKVAASAHGKRLDSARWFALVGTVDKKHPWVITDGGTFTVPVGGQLLCYFNDVEIELFYENNSGWVVLLAEPLDPA